jgi:MYXO-CTERM domain-containing protein
MVGDATFSLVPVSGGLITGGLGNFDPWGTPTISGSINPADDTNLMLATHSIEYGNALTVTLTGLTVGEQYKLQLLLFERAGPLDRRFDVALNGSTIASAFQTGIEQNRAIIETFIATSSTATINMTANPNQPTINALTLEHVPEPSRALLALAGLCVIGLSRRRSSSGRH